MIQYSKIVLNEYMIDVSSIDVSSIDVSTLDMLFDQLAKDCMMLEIVRANGLILLCGFLNNKALSPHRIENTTSLYEHFCVHAVMIHYYPVILMKCFNMKKVTMKHQPWKMREDKDDFDEHVVYNEPEPEDEP